MSYDTDYNGEVSITPPLTAAHFAMLHAIANRVTHLNTYEAIVPEDIRKAFEDKINELEQGFDFDADITPELLKFEYTNGGIVDDEVSGLEALITTVFMPLGYSLDGDVHWNGDESGDNGYIYFKGDKIEAVPDEILNPGPSWDKQISDALHPLHRALLLIARAAHVSMPQHMKAYFIEDETLKAVRDYLMTQGIDHLAHIGDLETSHPYLFKKS